MTFEISFDLSLLQLPENRQDVEIAALLVNGETLIIEEVRIPDLVVQNPMNQLMQTSTTSTSVPSHFSGEFPRFPSTSQDSGYQTTAPQVVDLTGPDPPVGIDGFEEGPIWKEEIPGGSYIVRRFVDSDNSCLFTAVAYVMERNRERGYDLRNIIASIVLSDPERYNAAVLGRPNVEYCHWITDPQHWGGEIELSILAQYYQCQIAAYDIRTTRCFVYGMDAGFRERVLVVYDGIHYDAIARSPYSDAPEEMDATVFNPSTQDGQIVLEAAESFVRKLNLTNQFTDLSKLQIRCDECGRGFTGQPEALAHGRQTGHTRFSEYR